MIRYVDLTLRACRPDRAPASVDSGACNRPNRLTILAKLAAGSLPRVHAPKVWAGNGSGAKCNGCDSTIAAGDVEIELELAGALVLHLHQRCFGLWQNEVERLARGSVETLP